MRFFLILALLFSITGSSVPQAGRQWRPATLRGITVGKSKFADMTRKWGKPKWSRNSKLEAGDEERQVTWTNYESAGEFPGPTTVVSDTRSGIITRINFYPDRLTKEQAVAHFGGGYIVTRYAFDYCLNEEESEAIYESPTGAVVVVEYRKRGIAIALGQKDMVTKISYVDGPIGPAKSRCGR
jgi:hypothetical protein